jgi:hypothetical protein
MFALLAYNMSGMMVTDHLGAVFRCANVLLHDRDSTGSRHGH